VRTVLNVRTVLVARALKVTELPPLDTLWLAAELSVFLHAQPKIDLPQRLAATCAEIAAGDNRRLDRAARWLEVYEVLTAPLSEAR